MFWTIIGNYNSHTITIQIIVTLFLVISLILSYTGKIKWIAKFTLGIANLYVGFIFFLIFETEQIYKYTAFLMYLCCGFLLIFDSIKNRNDSLKPPNKIQIFLLLLYSLYPLISFALGNTFPQLTTYIMPCSIISISILVYSGYQKKDICLLMILTTWAGIELKLLISRDYEDIILTACIIYSYYVVIKETS